MNLIRLFIAHSKAEQGPRLDELKEEIAKLAHAEWSNTEIVLTLGRDDYMANFARLGSWEAWEEDVALGVVGIERAPRFHGFVLPALSGIKSATAKILEKALARGKPVLAVDRGALRIVKALALVTDDGFKSTWMAATL